MANKTIHELSSIANLSSSDELAIYDVSGSVTGNGTIEGILGTDITGLDTTATNLIDAVNQHETAIESLDQSDLLYADDGQAPTGEVEFVSQDTSLTPSSSTSVTLLSGNDSWSQRFVKISQMFKNIRYLLGKLGSTDISSIGDGSVTGALSSLNMNLTQIFQIKSYVNISYTCPASGAVNITANHMGLSTPNGYQPVAVIAYTTNSNEVLPRSMIINATPGTNDSFCVLTNKSNSAVTTTFSCHILYIKIDCIYYDN